MPNRTLPGAGPRQGHRPDRRCGVPVRGWPSLKMRNRPGNQDGCKGARLTLGYRAHGAAAAMRTTSRARPGPGLRHRRCHRSLLWRGRRWRRLLAQAGTGSGAAASGTVAAVTLSPGTPTAQLYPGGQATVVLTVTNPNPGQRPGRVPRPGHRARGPAGSPWTARTPACGLATLSYATQTNGGAGWTLPGGQAPAGHPRPTRCRWRPSRGQRLPGRELHGLPRGGAVNAAPEARVATLAASVA